MLYRLEIENFYSIRERQIIDLTAAANVPDQPGRFAPLWRDAEAKAPRVMAIFGPNASGKSNILKALSFIIWFAKDSFSVPRGTRLPFDRFNDPVTLERATTLSIYFAGLEDIEHPMAQCRYVYTVTIGGGSHPAVEREALYYSPSFAARQVKLFERDAGGTVVSGKAFGLAGYRQALDKVLRPDASVISTLTQLNHPFAKSLWQAAANVSSNILLDRVEYTDDAAIRLYASNPALLARFNHEIERVDLGIRAMELRQEANGAAAYFTHNALHVPMPLLYESHGTRQFLKLFPLIHHALETGGIAILDELDAAIHPLLLPEILRWFYDPERNPHHAQLWMSCHNASLLDSLIKEEIFFCEKDGGGGTHIYGLRDVQSIRRTDDFYRKYLSGTLGAVPHIG